jgi:hypothetical protein
MGVYKIIGSYHGSEHEVIDEASSMQEAQRLLAEYQLGFGAGWYLYIQTYY